jgi:hypothetical protein
MRDVIPAMHRVGCMAALNLSWFRARIPSRHAWAWEKNFLDLGREVRTAEPGRRERATKETSSIPEIMPPANDWLKFDSLMGQPGGYKPISPAKDRSSALRQASLLASPFKSIF